MTIGAVAIGSAASLRALGAAHSNIEIASVVVIGDGDADLPIVARAPSLAQLEFAALPARCALLMGRPDPAEARAALAHAVDAGVQLKILAGESVRDLTLSDLVGGIDRGPSGASRLRDLIAGKRVLITGGGGSIGGELARQIAAMAPARLTLLDNSEFNLFNISLELPQATLALADIRDVRSVRRWFEREDPEIVFHAAALKQVPLVEAFVSEGVLTNIGGLRNVAEAAQAVKADLIFVSTDKAVDPSGVMGASKRLGEMYCQALDRRGGPRAVPIRLGNVLGSAGSVAPIFETQLAAGRALTVTHEKVTRYFLSIPQSAGALLRAAEAALAGEAPRGGVLVIDMGEPLPVVELARAVIRLAGLRPDVDRPIVFTGLRPGERLHEHLIAADERVASDAAGVSAVVSAPRGLAELHERMERLALLARDGADNAIVDELFAAITIAAADASVRAVAD
jgi:O-antigen biosynthesis protein WbqV